MNQQVIDTAFEGSGMYNLFTKWGCLRADLDLSIYCIQLEIENGFDSFPYAMNLYRRAINDAKLRGLDTREYQQKLLEIVSKIKARRINLVEGRIEKWKRNFQMRGLEVRK